MSLQEKKKAYTEIPCSKKKLDSMTHEIPFSLNACNALASSLVYSGKAGHARKSVYIPQYLFLIHYL